MELIDGKKIATLIKQEIAQACFSCPAQGFMRSHIPATVLVEHDYADHITSYPTTTNIII